MPDENLIEIDPEAKFKKLIALLNVVIIDLRDNTFARDALATSRDEVGSEIINIRDTLEYEDKIFGQLVTNDSAGSIYSIIIGNKIYLIGINRERFWSSCKKKIFNILNIISEPAEAVAQHHVQDEILVETRKMSRILISQINKIARIVESFRQDDEQLAELQGIAMRWWENKTYHQVLGELAYHTKMNRRELLSRGCITQEKDLGPLPDNVLQFPPERARKSG